MQNVWINVIRAGVVGVIGWRAMSPNGRKRFLQVLWQIAEGLDDLNKSQVTGRGAVAPNATSLTPGDIGGGPAIKGSPSDVDVARSFDDLVQFDLATALAGLG